MTRLRNWLSVAAALVIAGASVNVAMRDTAPPRPAQVIATAGPPLMFFVAARPAALRAVPEAFTHSIKGDRMLGDRNPIDSDGNPVPNTIRAGRLQYHYKAGPAVNINGNNWRLIEFRAPRYFANSWRLYADETPGVRFWGSMADAADACLSWQAPGDCRALLGAGNDCWVQSDGTLCRYGFTPGVDLDGNPIPCTPTASSTWHPCTVLAGQVPERIATESVDFTTDEEPPAPVEGGF